MLAASDANDTATTAMSTLRSSFFWPSSTITAKATPAPATSSAAATALRLIHLFMIPPNRCSGLRRGRGAGRCPAQRRAYATHHQGRESTSSDPTPAADDDLRRRAARRRLHLPRHPLSPDERAAHRPLLPLQLVPARERQRVRGQRDDRGRPRRAAGPRAREGR